ACVSTSRRSPIRISFCRQIHSTGKLKSDESNASGIDLFRSFLRAAAPDHASPTRVPVRGPSLADHLPTTSWFACKYGVARGMVANEVCNRSGRLMSGQRKSQFV